MAKKNVRKQITAIQPRMEFTDADVLYNKRLREWAKKVESGEITVDTYEDKRYRSRLRYRYSRKPPYHE